MVVVMHVRMMMREILLRLVTRLVLAPLQVPLHVLHLMQDLAMFLAQLSALCLQLGQILLPSFVVLERRDNIIIIQQLHIPQETIGIKVPKLHYILPATKCKGASERVKDKEGK